jgi:hypothetical protein
MKSASFSASSTLGTHFLGRRSKHVQVTEVLCSRRRMSSSSLQELRWSWCGSVRKSLYDTVITSPACTSVSANMAILENRVARCEDST